MLASQGPSVTSQPDHSRSEGNAAATQNSHIWIITSQDGTEPRSAQIGGYRGVAASPTSTEREGKSRALGWVM